MASTYLNLVPFCQQRKSQAKSQPHAEYITSTKNDSILPQKHAQCSVFDFFFPSFLLSGVVLTNFYTQYVKQKNPNILSL